MQMKIFEQHLAYQGGEQLLDLIPETWIFLGYVHNGVGVEQF